MSARAHALLPPSAARRWSVCTPSALLEAQFPDTSSESAAEGTLAHKLGELKLRNYFFGEPTRAKLTQEIKKLQKDPLWQSEMQGYTDEYKDYVKEIALSFKAGSNPFIAVEVKMDLSEWVPESFGTADCILISGETMWIIDFKYGKGVAVSAKDNPQLHLYALGAYARYAMLYPIKKVSYAIVQPRIDNTNTWSCTLDYLLAFGEWIKGRAALAFKGEGEYKPGEEQCRFCRARASCRARAEENVRLAFGDPAPIEKKTALLTPQEIGDYLSIGVDVEKWLSDLKDLALSKCLAGEEIPGWKAVAGRGSREWTDMDAAIAKLIEAGTPEEMLYERKVLTLAQMEKVIGKKDFADQVGEFVCKKPGKPTLVVESDKREAITNRVSAQEAFAS